MKKKSKKESFTRAKFLSALGAISLFPLTSKAEVIEDFDSSLQEYDILLKPDGTTVKVKKSNLSKSSRVKEKMDNPTMKKWLENKDL